MNQTEVGAFLPLERPRRRSAAEFETLLLAASMTGLELATRIGRLPSEVSRWRTGERSCPLPVVAYLELVVAARRCGVVFEPGRPVGRARKDHSAA